MINLPTKQDIEQAAIRIQPYIHRTPILTSSAINDTAGCSIYFKCENLQKAGVFKARGASNAVFSLTEEEIKKGVATHSSGNHAAALALAASLKKCNAYIVMPSNANKQKVKAVKSYGGQITFCEPTLQAREDTLSDIIAKTNAIEIHPYNNFNIIAGQATAAKELLEDYNDLEIIMTPVGGGGLLSGTALSAFYFGNNLMVIGCEPSGADDAKKSFSSKTLVPSVSPNTIADGLLTSLGSITFEVILNYVHDILLADDNEIISAMRLIWERMKIIVEPSSSVPLAVVLKNKELFAGKKVGIVLSGGNVDLNQLPFN
ncbi:MAG TPA: pyridoxal-phosphate dependent enzyme [Lentimicrobium sp.]|nr:pyridoxal-phosphate dependent enzyme [Lentimicrobium sp.]